MASGVLTLAMEAARRITAGRMHAAEGLRLVDDARRQIADTFPSAERSSRGNGPNRTPAGAACPSLTGLSMQGTPDRLEPARGFTGGCVRAVVHGLNPITEPVR